METNIRGSVRFLATSASLFLFLSAAAADDTANKAVGFEAKPLLKTNHTAVGGPLKLAYPVNTDTH